MLATVGPVLGLVAMAATSDRWLPWFAVGGGVEVMLFGAVATALAAGCLMPTHATSLLAGYLFGAWLGTLVGFLVVVVAAAVGFALWSRLVGARVLDAIAASSNARRVHAALLGRGFWRTTWLISLLRLSPLMPFAATNLLMASFGVRSHAFLLATAIGIAPRAIGVALVGAELSELDWRAGAGGWSTVVAIAATVLVLALTGRIAARALRRETAVGDGAGR
ncbi:MAG: VTT domain-containing protein [Planctomycetes bacterium]|nr:VTT domain-containing protein [Planctomycetota bacterium]